MILCVYNKLQYRDLADGPNTEEPEDVSIRMIYSTRHQIICQINMQSSFDLMRVIML